MDNLIAKLLVTRISWLPMAERIAYRLQAGNDISEADIAV